MTTMTDPQRASFQLSSLIYDTRYRSYTFQFIALVLLMLLIGYLGMNLIQNLAAQGQDISYRFLGEPSNYDINQRPIEYDSRSTHLRASVVGVLNTLIVAFLGCLTATLFGVTAGILRLSPNWLRSGGRQRTIALMQAAMCSNAMPIRNSLADASRPPRRTLPDEG